MDTNTVQEDVAGNNNSGGADVTKAEMLELLLGFGFSAEEIEKLVGAQSGFVETGVLLNKPLPVNPTPEEQRLSELYWCEQIKGLYRSSPFIGSVKGAQEIGLEVNEFRRIYQLLVRAGKLKYRLTIPAWVGAKKNFGGAPGRPLWLRSDSQCVAPTRQLSTRFSRK